MWGSSRNPAVLVEWPRGEATACKAVYTGSNPVSTSAVVPRAIGAAGARFLDTEEVTGSIPVSPTKIQRLVTKFGNEAFAFWCLQRSHQFRPRAIESRHGSPVEFFQVRGARGAVHRARPGMGCVDQCLHAGRLGQLRTHAAVACPAARRPADDDPARERSRGDAAAG